MEREVLCGLEPTRPIENIFLSPKRSTKAVSSHLLTTPKIPFLGFLVRHLPRISEIPSSK